MSICEECGNETARDGKICPTCRTKLYYEYSELRYTMWRYIKNHGAALAKEMYKLMIAEEGEEWVNKILGDKLVSALCNG